jgi:hypothetical protein
MLTTHRVLWFREQEGLEIPLHYIKDFKKAVKFLYLILIVEKTFWK